MLFHSQPPLPLLFHWRWERPPAGLRSGNTGQFTKYWMFCCCLSERWNWKIISQCPWVNIPPIFHRADFLKWHSSDLSVHLGIRKWKWWHVKTKEELSRAWVPWLCPQGFPIAQAPTLWLCEEFVFSFFSDEVGKGERNHSYNRLIILLQRKNFIQIQFH